MCFFLDLFIAFMVFINVYNNFSLKIPSPNVIIGLNHIAVWLYQLSKGQEKNHPANFPNKNVVFVTDKTN